MHFSMVGINHQSAPVAVREKLAVSAEKLPALLEQMKKRVPNGVILSTCNRTEIYATGPNERDVQEACTEFFRANLLQSDKILTGHLYSLSSRSLVEHLFRVACGLDSMAIGEYEILGQVGQALETAENAGMVNLSLRHIFQSAIRTGRRARQETAISVNALSISSIAVNKALDIIPDIRKCNIVIVGAGEAGRLALKVAVGRGAFRVAMVSRTRARAVALTSQYGGNPLSPDEFAGELNDAHIIIGCANSPHPVIRCAQVAEAMEKRPDIPLIIIDIAIPRNIEDGVRGIHNVHLYNLDDLNDIADGHRAGRESEIAAVEKIIAREVEIMMRWWHAHGSRPVIKSLMNRAEKIRLSQYNKALKKLSGLTEEERQAVDNLTRSIVDKVLRHPIMYLKSTDSAGSRDTVKRLFDLAEESIQ
jgi:glutamyl-tRNA reductase